MSYITNDFIDFVKKIFSQKPKTMIPKHPLVEQLYPRIRDKVYAFLEEAKNLNAYIFCGLRTMEEQAELYARGRTKPGKIVTNAKPGYSYHNYGLAIDVVFQYAKGVWNWNGNWKALSDLGIKHGFESGYTWITFQDKPHFQITFGQKVEKLKAIYDNRKKLEDVWSYLDRFS